MHTNKKWLYALLMLMLPLLGGCEEEETDKDKGKKYEGPSVVFEKVITFYSEEANLKIKLEAPLQVVQQNGDVDYPKGIFIHMYNKVGIKTTTLKGDQGKYIKDKELYTATGKVEVVNLEQKQTMYSEELNWEPTKRQIHTEQAIRIVTEREVLNGIGLVASEDFSSYQIKKPTGVFSINQ